MIEISVGNLVLLFFLFFLKRLHPTEAVQHLKNFLKKNEEGLKKGSKNVFHSVYVIAGTGHHSFSGGSKLTPHILQYLNNKGYNYIIL